MPLTDHKVRRSGRARSEGPVNGRTVLYNRFFKEVITEICIERLLNIPLISRYRCLHGIDII
jgi:hypothetical protein